MTLVYEVPKYEVARYSKSSSLLCGESLLIEQLKHFETLQGLRQIAVPPACVSILTSHNTPY